MSERINYDGIRRRVEKRMKARHEYFIHLAAYLAVNGGLWGIWLITGGGHPWPMYPMLAWGIGIFIHTVVFILDQMMESNRESLIDREIRREKMRLYGDPDYDDRPLAKPKRRDQQDMRLSDDGEIVPVDAETEMPVKRSSSRR